MRTTLCTETGDPAILYQSADTPLTFQLFKESPGQLVPFSLIGATEILAIFQTALPPPVVLKLSLAQLTITNAGGGEFTGLMSQTNAALLLPGLINIEIRVTIGGEVTTAELTQTLNVVPSFFPGV